MVDCKARVGHGSWLLWLEREFRVAVALTLPLASVALCH
jgi:hypothetical protein